MARGGTLSHGLTYIELMVVMGMVIILVALTVPRLFNAPGSGGSSTINDAQDLAHLLTVARANASSNRENDHWGIHLVDDGTIDCGTTVTSDCAVLYKGRDFDTRDSTHDQVFVLGGGNRWGQLDDTDFYFNKQSGLVRGIMADVFPEPVAHWSFEASSTVDVSLNGYDAEQVTGDIEIYETAWAVHHSYSIGTAGTGPGGLSVPDADVFRSDSFSVSFWAWINADLYGGIEDLIVPIAKTTDGTDGWEMYVPVGGLNMCFYVGQRDSNHQVCTGDLSFGSGATSFYNFIATVDGNNVLRLYQDGVYVGMKDVSDVWPANEAVAPMTILTNYDNSHYFTGVMDDVRFYDRALSEGEVMMIYDSYRDNSYWPENVLNLYITDGFASSTVSVLTSGAVRAANYDIGYVADR